MKTASGHVPLKIYCALRKFYLSCKEGEDEQETMRANDLGPRLITLILSNSNNSFLPAPVAELPKMLNDQRSHAGPETSDCKPDVRPALDDAKSLGLLGQTINQN